MMQIGKEMRTMSEHTENLGELENYKVDRAGWAVGEWDNEPDRIQWNHAGFACMIIRNQFGVWCGYVGVPEDHPYFGMPHQDVDVDVHGGLTYSDFCQGHICHIPEPGFPDRVWWLGFDCGHAFDLMPYSTTYRDVMPYRSIGLGDVYRNVAYVKEEVEMLAQQLASNQEEYQEASTDG